MFSTLPAELLLSVASYIDSQTDTLSLASSCRAFYPVLLPKVYKSIDLREHHDCHVSVLVHTLALKPELAREVRSLRVSNTWWGTSGVRYEEEVCLPVLKSAMGPNDDLSKWRRQLQPANVKNIWTVLLLALLPNVEDLVLHFEDSTDWTLRWMARTAEKKGSHLSKLRHFTAVCSDVFGGLSSEHFLPTLRLPSLRTFCGHMICDKDDSGEEYFEDQDFHAASYVPDNIGYSNVTHIHLKSCWSQRGFADLIGAPKNLESFILEHCDNPDDMDYDGMCASRYHPPFLRHRNTLKTLTLTAEFTNDYAAHVRHNIDYVGSFTGFSALKELRIQMYHILDWVHHLSVQGDTCRNRLSDVLPPSLESLTLDNLEEGHTPLLSETLKYLLLRERHCCPNLTYLEVKGNWMHVHQSTEESNTKPRPIPAMLDEFADFKAEFESLCPAVGVRFHLRDLHVEDIIERNRLDLLGGDDL